MPINAIRNIAINCILLIFISLSIFLNKDMVYYMKKIRFKFSDEEKFEHSNNSHIFKSNESNIYDTSSFGAYLKTSPFQISNILRIFINDNTFYLTIFNPNDLISRFGQNCIVSYNDNRSSLVIAHMLKQVQN